MMRRAASAGWPWALSLGMALATGVVAARAGEPNVRLDLPAQSMSVTLSQVARTGPAELMFDRTQTDARRAPRLRGRFTPAQALSEILRGSGLGFHRTLDGIYVIGPPAPNGASAHPLADPGDGAVSELLVMGRRSLNSGIRRSRDDIQPYDVIDSETLNRSGGETIEGFMRGRTPANAQAISNIQAPVANLGSTRSQIDLLGLGGGQTLVLVDGRRLPNLPNGQSTIAQFVQPDLNSIPMAAIERIEVLTSTAGAIYGPGATGGAVNVILKRDYQGQSVSFTQGLTSRGDAPSSRFDGHLGVSSADGRSGLSVGVGLSRSAGLRFGDRDYVEQARRRSLEQGPFYGFQVPVGRDVNVYSLSGPLVLDAAYGGQSLGSVMTHFSTQGFSAAEVLANAGSFDLTLSDDALGARQSLLTATRGATFIVSGRRQWEALEAFFDYLHADTQGRVTAPVSQAVFGSIAANSSSNPFQQPVFVAVPVNWDGVVTNRTLVRRGVVGFTARLPRGWTASADYSLSLSTERLEDERRQADLYAGLVVLLDGPLMPGQPALAPLGPTADFLKAYETYRLPGGYLIKQQDRLQDFNLRVAGPLAHLPGGPLTMTVLGEARLERAPLGTRVGWAYVASDFGDTVTPGLDQSTGSLYGEWRAPLVSGQARGPWRGLEAQVSLRADRYHLRVPAYSSVTSTSTGPSAQKASQVVVATTLGARTFLLPDLMLRASYADGFLPPTAEQINYQIYHWDGFVAYPLARDPKRGDTLLERGFDMIIGGQPSLRPEKARTLSVGLVYTPRAFSGLRVSVDYLRTDKTREIADFAGGEAQYFIDREAIYPDRIVRAPVTDADRAKGYTAGAIIGIDTSSLNLGRSIVESVDVTADYRRDLGRASTLRAYLRYTWQPSYRRRSDPDGAWSETVGYADGPLEHRGNLGVEWSQGDLTLGLNGQYYAGSKVAYSGFTGASSVRRLANQQATTIPDQAYLDAIGSYVFGRGGGSTLQLVVRNLLDTRAPIDANAAGGYSTYGDPRGRRFELTLSRRF